MSGMWGSITESLARENLKNALRPLLGHEVKYLQIPVEAAAQFEPSQIGTIIGTLVDAMLPHIALEVGVGLQKHSGILGDREGYPDFSHCSGYRIELKGLFKDNPNVVLKKPPTPREPSARLTQKVTEKNIQIDNDALLILVYQLEPSRNDPSLLSPVIVDLGILPVIECVRARDHRLTSRGGRWFGDFETPAVLSKAGKRKLKQQLALTEAYGRKESEGHDYNEDTNFGKLKRIPLKELQELLAMHGAAYAASGSYPSNWKLLGNTDPDFLHEIDEDDD